MRFHSAREAGLDEAKIENISDGYAQNLNQRETAALQLTDAIIGNPRTLTDADIRALQQQFTDAQIIELAMGVGLFLGMSKVLINLGLEPEDMPVTTLPTPGN